MTESITNIRAFAESATPSERVVEFTDIVNRRHLPALDGMRAVAVGSVMAFHYHILPFFSALLGVSLFFVLSGFLITLLLLREHEQKHFISLRAFYARRALRIFPAYYVFLLLSFGGMRILGTSTDVSLVVAAVLYLTNYAIAMHWVPSTLISHAWSLGVEEQFYAVWPALFAIGIHNRQRFKWLVLILLVAIACWRVFLIARGVRGYVYHAFDTRFDSLLVGCGLALCAQERWTAALATKASRHALLPVVTVVALLVPLPFTRVWNESLGYSVQALLLAILLVQMLMLSTAPAWRWLEHPVVRYVGTISYPLYLYHQLVAAMVSRFGGWRSSVQTIAAITLTLVLASASYFIVEKPFLRRKQRWEPLSSAQ